MTWHQPPLVVNDPRLFEPEAGSIRAFQSYPWARFEELAYCPGCRCNETHDPHTDNAVTEACETADCACHHREASDEDDGLCRHCGGELSGHVYIGSFGAEDVPSCAFL